MTIKTGDKPNAGTDANVYFALHGNKGETPRIALQDESQTFKRFESGRADKFVVQTADVGKVRNWGSGVFFLLRLVHIAFRHVEKRKNVLLLLFFLENEM